MDTYQIQLEEAEKRLCDFIARQRQANNRAISPVNHALASKEDPLYIEKEGVMSELAFCKLLNTYPYEIFNTQPRSVAQGEDCGDVIYGDHCIDVKVTKYETGRLISVSKNPAVSLIVMMIGEHGTYRLAGGMRSSDMYSSIRFGTPNGFRKPCFSATQDELIDPDTLMDWIFLSLYAD
jgi:hypothetical protein